MRNRIKHMLSLGEPEKLPPEGFWGDTGWTTDGDPEGVFSIVNNIKLGGYGMRTLSVVSGTARYLPDQTVSSCQLLKIKIVDLISTPRREPDIHHRSFRHYNRVIMPRLGVSYLDTVLSGFKIETDEGLRGTDPWKARFTSCCEIDGKTWQMDIPEGFPPVIPMYAITGLFHRIESSRFIGMTQTEAMGCLGISSPFELEAPFTCEC